MVKLKQYKYLIIIISLFILYNSFFINKAFHIDDPFTISMARAVNTNFLKPDISFLGNPLLLGYYYAPIIKIFGESEHWLHIFYFPFSILVIVSMFFLSSRFTKKSLFPVIFLISTPAFIISSQSIMLDIPFLGFFLAAVVAFIYGVDKNNNSLLILSGLFTGMAILTKYSGIIIIPILFIYALLNLNKKKIKFLLIPVSIFILWNIYCILFYKDALFLSALSWKIKDYLLNRIGIRVLASLSFLSGTSIIILLLVPLLLLKRKKHPYFFLSLISGIFPFIIKGMFNEYALFEKLFLAILFISSSYIILLILKACCEALFKKNNKDIIFLSCWFLLIFVFNLFINFISARFLLLLLPPLFLFIYNELSSYNFKIAKFKVRFIIFISIIFSTILAIGDYQFAGLYRNFVYSLSEIVPLKEKTSFYCGKSYTSWGYSYYLQKFGYPVENHNALIQGTAQRQVILITPTEPVLPIVIKRKPFFDKDLDLLYNRNLLDSMYYRGYIILHNRKFHSGFYSHDWGLLPFYLSIRKVPLEVFKIYKLSYSPKDTLLKENWFFLKENWFWQ